MKNRKLAFLSLSVALSVFFCACSQQEAKKATRQTTSSVEANSTNETTTENIQPEPKTSATTKHKPTEPVPPTTVAESKVPATATENITLTENEQSVFEKTNLLRKSMGLEPYKINYELCKLARQKAENIRDLGYFDHLSPTLGYANDMMNRAGIGYKSAAENLAKGNLVPSSAMLGWFKSDGHREALLNEEYKEIGIGVIHDDGVSYWVQMFIDPK